MSSSMEMIRGERPVVIDDPARLVTIKKNSGAPDVQMFDSSAINASIDRHMEQLKDKTVLAIAYVDKSGASVAVVGRIRKIPGEASWTILGTRNWSGNWTASAALRWSI